MFASKGQTLVELIVVVAVSTLIIGGLVFMTVATVRNNQLAKSRTQATKLTQEALEWVKTGRDRDLKVSSFSISGNEVISWSDPDMWLSIASSCSPNCYFKVDSQGQLTYLAAGSAMPSNADNSINPFLRAVILSDDSSFATQKKVTAIVTWTDALGPHESKLTTVLGKL